MGQHARAARADIENLPRSECQRVRPPGTKYMKSHDSSHLSGQHALLAYNLSRAHKGVQDVPAQTSTTMHARSRTGCTTFQSSFGSKARGRSARDPAARFQFSKSTPLPVYASADHRRHRQQGAGDVLSATSIRQLEAAGGSFDWALQGASQEKGCHICRILY